jgi:TolB-like protein/DNA-binding winged helix-turn-helix (wHTH) protein
MTSPDTGLLPIYVFADLTLDTGRRQVLRDARPIEIGALNFDLLRTLVEATPNVVTVDSLAEKVWGRHFVSPENVAQRVMLLRQSLADDASQPRYIETVRNKGYRLIPVAERVQADKPGPDLNRRWPAHTVAGACVIAICLAAAAVYWLARAADHSPPTPSSLAVLPFDNLSPDAGDAYFAAGMQDEIVNQLAKIGGLRVFPVRTSTSPESLAKIIRDLNVANVVRGGVHYAAGRVRVNVQLSAAANGEIVWSDSVERERSDIFAIQRDIALDVAQALRLKLSSAERTRIEHVPTANPNARDLYLRARARNWVSDEGLLAINEYERALELDPAFKEAWAHDSVARSMAQFIDASRKDDHRMRAEQAARRALALDPEYGPGYSALGMVLTSRNDWNGAEAAFRNAEALNVPLTEMGSYAFLQLSAGKFGGVAKDIFEAAQAGDPSNAIYYRFLVFVYEGLGEPTRARSVYESALLVFPNDSREAQELRAMRMHWLVGRNELAAARELPMRDLNAAMLANLDAPPPRALAELRSAQTALHREDQTGHRDIGLWAGHFGDPMLALEAMRTAIGENGSFMVWAWLPQLAEMRQLPEFRAYMREIGLVEYWQQYGWPPFCRPVDEHDFECE